MNKKEPISKDVLIESCDKYIDENDLLMVRNLTMILFCFVFHVFDEYIVLNIQKSKTDQYRQGNEVLIASGVTTACPVKMYLRYLDLLGTVEDKDFQF